MEIKTLLTTNFVATIKYTSFTCYGIDEQLIEIDKTIILPIIYYPLQA